MKKSIGGKIRFLALLSILTATLFVVFTVPAEPAHAEEGPQVTICGQGNILPGDGQWHTAQEMNFDGWSSGRMRLSTDMETLELDGVIAEVSGPEMDTLKAENVMNFNVIFNSHCELTSSEGYALSMMPGWGVGFYHLTSEAEGPQILNGGIYAGAPTNFSIDKGDFICDVVEVEYFTMNKGSLTVTSRLQPYGLNVNGGRITCDGATLYTGSYTQKGGTVIVCNETKAGGDAPADIDVLMTSGGQTEISGGSLDVYNETGAGLRFQNAKISGGNVSAGSRTAAGAEIITDLNMTGGTLRASSAKAGEALYVGSVNEDFDDVINIAEPRRGRWQTDSGRMKVVDAQGNDVWEIILKKMVSVEPANSTPLKFEETFTVSEVLDQINVKCTYQDNSTEEITLTDLPWRDLQPGPDQRLTPDTEYIQAQIYGMTVQIPIEVIRYPAPQNLKADLTGITGAQRASLTWDPVAGATSYMVQRSEWQDMRGPRTILAEEAELADPMIPGSVWYYRVQAVQEVSNGTYAISDFCEPVRIAAALAAPTGCKAELSPDGVSVSWDPVPGADEYTLEQSDDPEGPFTDAIGRPALASDTQRQLVSPDPGSIRYYRVTATASNHRAADRVVSDPGEVFFAVRPPEAPQLQGSASHSDAVISWGPVSGAASYRLERSDDGGNTYQEIARIEDPDPTDMNHTDAIGFSKTGYYRMTAIMKADGREYPSEASQPLQITTPDPAPEETPVDPTIKKPAGIDTKGNSKNGTMRIFFKPVKGAVNYSIAYRLAGAKEWTYRWTDGKTEYTVGDLKKGQLLEFKFAAYKDVDGVLTRGDYSRTSYRYMKSVEKASAKAGKKSLTVKVKKVSGASGYQVLYATNKKMTGAKMTTFKGGKKTKLKVSGLKKGKTYYVRYRPYKNKGGRIYYGVLKKTLKVRVK